MMLWSVPGAVARRLAHYARTAARPGGMRYLARRTREVATGVIRVCAGTMVKITQQITQKARHQLRLEETASSLSMPREQLGNLVRRMSVAKPKTSSSPTSATSQIMSRSRRGSHVFSMWQI